jgi:hypothetical protein
MIKIQSYAASSKPVKCHCLSSNLSVVLGLNDLYQVGPSSCEEIFLLHSIQLVFRLA